MELRLSEMTLFVKRIAHLVLYSDMLYVIRALHFAAMIPGNTDVLELLLSHGADINATNADNSTPLFFSCQSDNMFSAGVLIAHGADIHLRNNKGQ